MNIIIIGSGFVGLTTGACLANVGHHIRCADVDVVKVDSLLQGKLPFYEPGLQELIQKNREAGRLTFTTSVSEAINFGEVIFNCVGTPSQENGSADLNAVFVVAKDVATFSKGKKVLVNKSTVPPGTARRCQTIIRETNPTSKVEVISNPEFLKQGSAVHDFDHPDKIVVGAESQEGFEVMRKVYHGLLKTYTPLIEIDWETAEMIKYANNAFLATKISYINEIANICEKMGADVKAVAQAIGMDYRIGPKFLNAGIGYGGSCFPKDVRAMASFAHENGYEANLLRQVDHTNERQKLVLLEKIKRRFGENIAGKIFTIWGLSYKPKTSDIREAPAIVLIKELLREKAKINVYDPVAVPEIKKIFNDHIQCCTTINGSVENSSAIILVTEWDEFRNVDFRELGKSMRDRILFDGRNIYEPEMVRADGFEYVGIGRRN